MTESKASLPKELTITITGDTSQRHPRDAARPHQHHHHRLPAGDADSDVLHGHHQRPVCGPVGADFACSWPSCCMPVFGFSLNMIVLFRLPAGAGHRGRRRHCGD
ncbi:MAG: hypothetical protein WKG07_19295 [Hymenobacter sp.]